VLRLFTNDQWLASEPDLAAHEAAVLEHLERIDLPTPELIAFDADGSRAGVPAVLMTLLPGEVDLLPDDPASWLAVLAQPLGVLHSSPLPDIAWSYDPWVDQKLLRPPEWTKQQDLWEEAFEVYATGLPFSPQRFLHRDYHPVNVLWVDGAISGVVDWVNGCVGPQSSDVAHCRLNLALMYGYEIADRFLDRIEDPYDRTWDLAPALSVLENFGVYTPWADFGLQHLSEPIVRERLEEFIARSLASRG